MSVVFAVDSVDAWGSVENILTSQGLSPNNAESLKLTIADKDLRLRNVVDLSLEARLLGQKGFFIQSRADGEYAVLTSHWTMKVVFAAGAVGLICWYERLPIIGASVVIAPLLYIGGAAVRYRYETGQAACLAKLSEAKREELKATIKNLKNELIGPGFSDSDLSPTEDKEFEPQDLPSLWGLIKPYSRGMSELLAVLNLTSALLQVSGFRNLGHYLHITRYVGISAVVGAAAIRGIYDRDAKPTHRIFYSAGVAGMAAILGGIAYQNATGCTFGEWQWAWLIVSRTEHLGYLGFEIYKRSAPLRDLWSLLGHHEKSKGSKMVLDSLALAHSLISLVRPSLRYSGLLDYGTKAYLGLRLAEGMSGILPVIWNHGGKERFERYRSA
jgi:hypothetical protein